MSNNTQSGSPVPGVYAIICTETGTQYVGSSVNVLNRLRSHFAELEQRRHGNRRIQTLYNQYGRDGFRVLLLKEVEDREERLDVEQEYIDSGAYTLNISDSSRHIRKPNKTALKRYDADVGKVLPKKVMGLYRTPWGRFNDPKKAATACPVLFMTDKWVRLACELPHEQIDAGAYKHSAYLQTHYDDAVIGRTYADLGFGFEPETPNFQFH